MHIIYVFRRGDRALNCCCCDCNNTACVNMILQNLISRARYQSILELETGQGESIVNWSAQLQLVSQLIFACMMHAMVNAAHRLFYSTYNYIH